MELSAMELIDTETRRLLVEAAYLACVTNQPAQARRILAGLAATTPGAPEVVIGEALASLTEGQAEAAADRLRGLAAQGDPQGTVVLALALKIAGRASESASILARVRPGDPATDAMADALRRAT